MSYHFSTNGVQDYFFYELAQALMCVMSSQNSLFGQVSLVLAFYTKFDKTLQFLALNSLYLKPLVFDALADLAALLKVVQAVLLDNLSIHANLVPVHKKCAHSHQTRSAI